MSEAMTNTSGRAKRGRLMYSPPAKNETQQMLFAPCHLECAFRRAEGIATLPNRLEAFADAGCYRFSACCIMSADLDSSLGVDTQALTGRWSTAKQVYP